MDNLNDLKAEDVEDGTPIRARPGITHHGDVSVVMDRHEETLVRLIRQHSAVFGCVAWLANKPILRACHDKDAIFVVQKEDFLRPDADMARKDVQSLYGEIGRGEDGNRHLYPGLCALSTATDYSFGRVRCVGNHNKDKNPAWPRMHHKFCVFGDWVEKEQQRDDRWEVGELKFSCVWTGSFNLTHTGTRSLENAVIIRRPEVAARYYEEFVHAFSLSEPLDWESEWCAPEYRFGT